MTTMAPAKLNQANAKKIAHILSLLLADTYITYLKTQNFHWNLEDPRFTSLHLFFEKKYEELADAVDEIAERIRVLKIKAPGTMQQFLEMGTIKEAKGELSGDQMVRELYNDREVLITYIRPRIKEVIDLGDEGTGDLLIQQLRMHEKAAWMLMSSF